MSDTISRGLAQAISHDSDWNPIAVKLRLSAAARINARGLLLFRTTGDDGDGTAVLRPALLGVAKRDGTSLP